MDYKAAHENLLVKYDELRRKYHQLMTTYVTRMEESERAMAIGLGVMKQADRAIEAVQNLSAEPYATEARDYSRGIAEGIRIAQEAMLKAANAE